MNAAIGGVPFCSADRLADQSGDEHLRKAGDPGRSPGQQRLDADRAGLRIGHGKAVAEPTAMIGPNNASGIQKPAKSSAKASPAPATPSRLPVSTMRSRPIRWRSARRPGCRP